MNAMIPANSSAKGTSASVKSTLEAKKERATSSPATCAASVPTVPGRASSRTPESARNTASETSSSTSRETRSQARTHQAKHEVEGDQHTHDARQRMQRRIGERRNDALVDLQREKRDRHSEQAREQRGE